MAQIPDGVPPPVEIIAVRTFELAATDGSLVAVPCTLYRPEPSKDRETYYCWVRVEWPSGPELKRSAGADAIQALELGLVLLGILINTSDAAKQNRITWLGDSKGFGLPLPVGLWDLYREHDRQGFLSEYRVPRSPRYHRLNLRQTAPKYLRVRSGAINRCWCGGIVGNSRRPKRQIKGPD